MKKEVLIGVLSMLCLTAKGQLEQVILTYGKQTRWLIVCPSNTAETCELLMFYPNGKQRGKANVIYHDAKNRFRPNGDVVIYHENGQVFQQYDHETGTLLTYYPTGELEAKMITPIDGTLERKFKYYKNGQIWEEEEAKHEVGRQNLTMAHRANQDFIYDNHGYSYNYFKTFHPNGKLQSFTFIDATAPHLKYIQQFYAPDGELDTTAASEQLHGRFMKQGRRYSYFPNGQLQEQVDYQNDQFNGEQLRWLENGQLVWKASYQNGSRMGKFEACWEDGSPKEVGYYAGGYKHGPVLRWHRDGRIVEQGSYFNGNPLAVATIWDTVGGIWAEGFGWVEVQQMNFYYNKSYWNDKTFWLEGRGSFQKGMRDGKWRFFYKKIGDSKLAEEKIGAVVNYRNGVLHGKAEVWSPDGTQLLEANFADGWLEGDYLAKREAGQIAAKGQFKHHKKDGIWTTYHYNSDQVHQIQRFENGEHQATLKEYTTEGFLRKDWVDNKKAKQIELYDYYENGTYLQHVRPYHWKNYNYYEFDEHKKLKKSRELNFDNPKTYTLTEFYPNGQRKSLGTFVENRPDGAHWTWHKNGKLQSETHFEGGKRHGVSYSWDEAGFVTERFFQNGIETIPDTREERALECACNHPPSEVAAYSFLPLFADYVPHEKVAHRTPFYNIPEASYRRLFAKVWSFNGNYFSGEMTVFNDFYVDVHNGLRLNFTACRRGLNRTKLEVVGWFDDSRNAVEITLSNFDCSVEFPQNILRLYDPESRQPLHTPIEKYQRSSVRYEIEKFDYSDDSTGFRIEAKVAERSQPCYQISEIGQTGVLFNGKQPKMDFLPNATVDLPWSEVEKADDSLYLPLKGLPRFLPPLSYLNQFIGVYFPEGKVYIPFTSGQITATASHVWVSGTEIYGNLNVPTATNLTPDDLKALPDFLQKKGFEILKYSIQENEVLHLFWRYTPQPAEQETGR